MNPVLETLPGHRSIRRFSDEPASDDNLTLVVKAAQSTPNWVNLQLVSMQQAMMRPLCRIGTTLLNMLSERKPCITFRYS